MPIVNSGMGSGVVTNLIKDLAGLASGAIYSSQYANFNAAVVAATGKALVINTTVALTATLTTLPCSSLSVTSDGLIELGGYDLTIDVPFQAGLYQCFDTNGNVTGLRELRPEWFGTTPNGTAFNKAFLALEPGGVFVMSSGTYVTSDAKILCQTDGVTLKGAGIDTIIQSSQAVIMEISSATFNTAANLTTSLESLDVTGFMIDGITKGTNIGIVMSGVRNSEVSKLQFKNVQKGIEWRGVSMTTFRDFEYQYETGTTNANRVDYIIYGDSENYFYRNADNIIRGWKTQAVLAHVYLNGFPAGTVNGHVADGVTNIFDGLTIENNIFFGGQNILSLDSVRFLNINNNKLFQPDRTNIYLKDCQDVVVSNNHVTWQSAFGNASYPGHGIHIDNSATINGVAPHFTNLMYFNNSPYSITGNIIEAVSGHGIFINNAFSINVANNTILRPNYLATGFTTRLVYSGINIANSIGGNIENNSVIGSFTTTPGARVTRDHRHDIQLYQTGDLKIKHDRTSEIIDSTGYGGNVIETQEKVVGLLATRSAINNNIVGVDPENVSAWTNAGTTIGAAEASPTGSVTAKAVTTSAVNQYLVLPTNVKLTANTIYTASIYLRSTTDRAIDIALFDGNATTILKTVHTYTPWQRYAISFKTGSTTGALGSLIVGSYSTNAQAETIGSFVIWGAKIEIGSIETTYINDVGLGTAAPISGWHAKGDRVINSAPTVGQPKAWSCTVAGIPGTWVSEGNL